MRYHKTFLLIFLSFLACNAFADIFTITSNADSGPGTLRDALTQAAANGTAVKDYVNFNIADHSVTGRTIVIHDALPDISSNLIIDGTTQPGNPFGVSAAKVSIVVYYTANKSMYGLSIFGQHDVELYGLMLDKDPAFFGLNGSFTTALFIQNSQNITIGAPGKGNVIKNFDSNLGGNDFYRPTQATVSRNVKISANFIGINEDGTSICALGSSSVQLSAIEDFTFGGNTPEEGNVCYGTCLYVKGNDNNMLSLGYVLISQNIFGLNYTGTAALTNGSSDTNGFSISDFTGGVKQCKIIDNLTLGGFQLQLSCFFYMQGNKVGTDITGNTIIQHSSLGVVLGYCSGGGLIGGTNPGDGNIFAGCGKGGIFNSQFGTIYNVDSRGVEVVGNNIACNNGLIPNNLQISNDIGFPLGTITITDRSNNSVNGTATPNSRVDLYYSILCNYCEPQKIFASVNADASGNWSYNGTLSNYSISAASTINGQTSAFTELMFTNPASDVKITMACAGSNGSITGLKASNALSYQWYDANGKAVGNTIDLINMPAGKYHLAIGNGYCTNSSAVYEIIDLSAQIDNSNQKLSPASCNSSTGSITGLRATSYTAASWADESGTVVGNTIDLLNVKAGNYTVTLNTSAGCTQFYGPVTIINSTGPNINQSAMVRQPTSCGQSTGAITGIIGTGSGTLNYVWKNAAGTKVGTSADLLNQPAGQYILEVSDNTTCGPVYSSSITIAETNGITMDESNVKIIVESCGLANGSVTGIQVSGATQYQWTDASNKVVNNTFDLTGVAQGDYSLTASNSYGCIKRSKTYHVGQQMLTTYPKYNSLIIGACYGQANGSIVITADALVISARWVYQGITVGSGLSISNLTSGKYQLYLTDANGCEQLYDSYAVGAGIPLQFTPGGAQINNDGCSLKTGSVTNIQVTGGYGPYSYTWKDVTGKTVGSSVDLINIGAGVYTVNITDSRSCAILTDTYIVQNQDNVIIPPVINHVQICSPGDALILVSNPLSSLTYKLYASANAISPVSTATDGRFSVNAKVKTVYYISQLSGSCESSRTPVTVSVGISAADIPNTITPNADGINDYWKISGIENYPQAMVHIYNRYGKQLYESRGYATPFNGTYNGNPLPYGVYYYLIVLSNSCNLLSGSLTIVR